MHRAVHQTLSSFYQMTNYRGTLSKIPLITGSGDLCDVVQTLITANKSNTYDGESGIYLPHEYKINGCKQPITSSSVDNKSYWMANNQYWEIPHLVNHYGF